MRPTRSARSHRGRGGAPFDVQVARVMWVTMMLGLATYAVVAYCLLSFGIVDLEFLVGRYLWLAVPAGVVVMAAARLVRRPMVDAIPSDATPEVREQRYAAAVLVSLGLIEGAGLLLVTLGLAAGAPMWGLIGGGVGVAFLAASGPSREEAGLGR